LKLFTSTSLSVQQTGRFSIRINTYTQGRIQPVSLGKAISVKFGSQVSLPVFFLSFFEKAKRSLKFI